MSLNQLDEDIRTSRERARRAERLTQRRASVMAEIETGEATLAELERELTAEEADVTRLEGRSLASFIASVTGNKDERLARERTEAEAARRRVHRQRDLLESLHAGLREIDAELAGLDTAGQDFETALERKEKAVRDSGGPRSAQVTAVVQALADAAVERRELSEATQAGQQSLAELETVAKALNQARSVSTMAMGPNPVLNILRHGQLEKADQAAWQAQRALDAFARELADLGIAADQRLAGIAAPFAEIFFDNMMIDMRRHQRVLETRKAVESVTAWVRETLEELRRRDSEVDRRLEELRRSRQALLEPEG